MTGDGVLVTLVLSDASCSFRAAGHEIREVVSAKISGYPSGMWFWGVTQSSGSNITVRAQFS